ncbi:MAG: DNA adenine methylase [Alistipes sp.]|jgi:hypothetical protein|nr:DNA adenine methylase [Alistipes sp.]
MEQKRQIFKCAPLPFQGQKRHFVSEFARLLEAHNEKQEIRVVVDLFGGSGLLAHVAKRVLPNARVIFNDYDNYSVRLAAIGTTNEILGRLREIVAGTPKTLQLAAPTRARVLKLVGEYDHRGYVDYITVSSNLLFPGKYALDFEDLSKSGLYNRVRKSYYDIDAGDYLSGLEVRNTDYKELFEEFKDTPGVIFLVDPPYLSTDTKTYGSDKYWKLRDYLDVLKVLGGSRYVYFTSNKSSLPELGQWLGENVGIGNPFDGAEIRTRSNSVNPLSGYEDMMLYKLSA